MVFLLVVLFNCVFFYNLNIQFCDKLEDDNKIITYKNKIFFISMRYNLYTFDTSYTRIVYTYPSLGTFMWNTYRFYTYQQQ